MPPRRRPDREGAVVLVKIIAPLLDVQHEPPVAEVVGRVVD